MDKISFERSTIIPCKVVDEIVIISNKNKKERKEIGKENETIFIGTSIVTQRTHWDTEIALQLHGY